MKRLFLEYYLLVLILAAGFTWFVYPQLPQVMVTHWGISGEANGWMQKSSGAWLVPIIMAIVWLVWELMPVFDSEFSEEKSLYPPYRFFGLFMLLFLGIVHVAALGVNLGWQINMIKMVSWQLVLLTAVMGQLLPLLPRNMFMGIRTIWSLKSDRTWRITHQETGRWCRALSLIDIVLLLSLPQQAGFLAVLTGFIGCLLLGVGYSYIYRR